MKSLAVQVSPLHSRRCFRDQDIVNLMRWAAALGFLCSLAASGALAQPELPSDLARPTVGAVRIDASEAPNIDGDLSDPAWSKASVIDRFIQKRPNPGMPATERTVLRI